MDEKLIIYIVLGVIIFVVKTVIKKKKASNNSVAPSNNKEPKVQNEIKDLFDELIFSDNNQAKKEPLNNRITSEVPKKAQVKKPVEKIIEYKKEEFLFDKEDEEVLEEFEFDHSEIRNAVIYSEIFNRKEY